MTKKKKKLKFKVRNWLLMFDTWFILIGFGLAISYGVWKIHEKNKQGPSEIIEKCLKENKSLLSDCLEVISSNSSEISLEDPDKNLRYVGSNPNNYLSLGDTYLTNVYRGFTSNGSSYKDYSSISTCLDDQEYGHKCIVVHKKGDPILWRIVGIFRIDDEPHVKLVRDESIGDYSWDSSRADVNMGYGVNEWSQADLRVLLNEGAYFQSKEGSCFNLEKTNLLVVILEIGVFKI